MQRFLDYTPTKEELWRVIGDDDAFVKLTLDKFDQAPGGDFEKQYIALLLFERGQHESSRKVLETIEDEKRRRACLEEHHLLWCDTAKGYM